MGYKLTDGTWDKGGRDGVFVGENFAYMFEDTKRPSGRNTVDMYSGYDNLDESGMPVKPQPYFDSMKTAYTLDISSDKEDDKKITRQLEAAGRMKEDYGKGEETSMGLVMDLEMLKTLLDQQAKLSGRKPEWKKGYSGALVKVKDMNQAEVETGNKTYGLSDQLHGDHPKAYGAGGQTETDDVRRPGSHFPVCGSPGNYQHMLDYVHI